VLKTMEQTMERRGEIRACQHHVYYCFDALSRHLEVSHGVGTDSLQTMIANDGFVPCPMFVTWNIVQKTNSSDTVTTEQKGILRGCIGTFSAKPIAQGLEEYAVTAAVRDTRFPPIRAHELNESLHCSVSLLHSFEEAASWQDWEVGTHGVTITFSLSQRGNGGLRQYSATFLPEVASEQGWDHLTTITHLIRKSGCDIEYEEDEVYVYGGMCRGVVLLDTVLQHCLRVERYQSSKCSVSFDEYKEFVLLQGNKE